MYQNPEGRQDQRRPGAKRFWLIITPFVTKVEYPEQQKLFDGFIFLLMR